MQLRVVTVLLGGMFLAAGCGDPSQSESEQVDSRGAELRVPGSSSGTSGSTTGSSSTTGSTGTRTTTGSSGSTGFTTGFRPQEDPAPSWVWPTELRLRSRSYEAYNLAFRCGYGTTYQVEKRVGNGTWQSLSGPIRPAMGTRGLCGAVHSDPPSGRGRLCYRVRGRYAGISALSNTLCTEPPPEAPRMMATRATADTVRIDFEDDGTRQTEYVLERQVQNTTDYEVIARISSKAASAPMQREYVDSPSFDGNLDRRTPYSWIGVPYGYRLSAVRDGVRSRPSEGYVVMTDWSGPKKDYKKPWALSSQKCEVRGTNYVDPDFSRCKRASEAPGCISQEWLGGSRCLVLDANAGLCSSDEAYDLSVFLTHDGTTFDCNGQRIDHGRTSGGRSAFQAPRTYSVSDVEIRDCKVNNPEKYGVVLKRFFRGMQLSGPMEGHRNIRIRNVRVANGNNHAVYVGQNSRDIDIDGLDAENVFTGVYLEAGTRRTRIANSRFSRMNKREAISVDSAMDNVIEHNEFENNPHGGIHLYKNCGEPYGQVCPIRRALDASNNTIRHNVFRDSDVRIAWRQFKTYTTWNCIGMIGVGGKWRDHSADNYVHDNLFVRSKLDVQDAPNYVFDNIFDNTALEIGSDDPLGDDPVRYSGYVGENDFRNGALFAVEGSRSQVFRDDMEVRDNTLDGGRICLDHFYQKDDCATAERYRHPTDFGCFSGPWDIPANDGACSVTPVGGGVLTPAQIFSGGLSAPVF